MLPPWLIDKQRKEEERRRERSRQQPALRIDDGRLAWEEEQRRKQTENDRQRGSTEIDFRL